MREQIHTIPVNEAFDAHDECPFCFMERKVEQSAIRFVAGPGASYMEPDVRGATDRAGFCVHHMQKLYTYGNALGNGLMLQTYLACFLEDFQREKEEFVMPEKKPLFGKRKQPVSDDPYWKRLRTKVESCYICDKMEYNMSRYYKTFFTLLKEPEFRAKVENSKGFCMTHFAQLMQNANQMLPKGQTEWFYGTIPALTKKNLIRVKEDLDWFIAKFDYRNAGADWKNSKDALSRTMQKLETLYPADPPYKKD